MNFDFGGITFVFFFLVRVCLENSIKDNPTSWMCNGTPQNNEEIEFGSKFEKNQRRDKKNCVGFKSKC